MGDLVEHCCELLAPLGTPRARRMFGGHGLYVDDCFVAIVSGRTLYLKVDDQTAPRFDAAGGRPFAYAREGRELTLGFRTVPPEALESPAAMAPWARLALEAARRALSRPRKARRGRARSAAGASAAAATLPPARGRR